MEKPRLKFRVDLDLIRLLKVLINEQLIYVSASTLSSRIGLTLRSSKRVLRELEALGLASRWSKSTYKLDLAKALSLVSRSRASS